MTPRHSESQQACRGQPLANQPGHLSKDDYTAGSQPELMQ